MIFRDELVLPQYKRGYWLITDLVQQAIGNQRVSGLLHIFLKHTSAAICMNENADSSVRADFETFMNDLVPEKYPKFKHISEGSDDMPAHIKSSLFGNSLLIPVTNGRLDLGTWQGIYLCEFRNFGGNRTLVLTLF